MECNVYYKRSGVVAYPVMQAYGSLALEENLEVSEGVLNRCSISRVCTSTIGYKPKKETHGLQWGLLGEDLVISSTCEMGVFVWFPEGPILNGPEFLSPTSVP